MCACQRRYPVRKDENWWLVVGDPKANTLLAIKRVALQRKARIKLDFVAPASPGSHHLTLFFMCDSYLGCDQVPPFLPVHPCSLLILLDQCLMSWWVRGQRHLGMVCDCGVHRIAGVRI